MKYSPRLHVERLEERITPDASTPMPMPTPTPTPPDQTVVTSPPASAPVINIAVPTPAQMLDALNAFLATLPPPPPPPSTAGYFTGLGSGLGGGSLGQ